MIRKWLMRWALIAFIWAFFEAVWFFIIVDVIISLAVMRFGVLRALVPAVAALAGALFGGITLYYWAIQNPQTVQTLMLTVPGVTQNLLDTTAKGMAQEPLKALLFGGFTGIPFKLFAAQAYEAGLAPLGAFLAPAFIARLSRLGAVLAFSALLRALLYKRLRRAGLIRLTMFIWILFYAWFGYVFWNLF